LLKYIQGGDMFRLYRAIIRPYLRKESDMDLFLR